MPVEDYDLIRTIALTDVEVLKEKGKTYGDSWKKRGGVGAFMMLARKWDRLENMTRARQYDVFALEASALEEIQDLRAYLLLVEAEWRSLHMDAEN